MSEGPRNRRSVGSVFVNRDGAILVRDLYRRRRYRLRRDLARPGSVIAVEVRRDEDGGDRAHPFAELAAPGAVKAALYEILAHFAVSPLYPPEVEAEAEAWLERPGLDDERLSDLTGLPFVTIDNEGSRDLDQALHIRRGEGGQGYLVSYALADASYYVRPGSALFNEALRRGATFYLPRLAAPMLPRVLSEGLISLNPGVLRRALVLEMALDDEGRLRHTTVRRALIRSRAQLTYAEVQRFHDQPMSSPLAGRDCAESLALLREVGERRIADARARDVVCYDRAELGVDLASDEGTTLLATARARNDVERWNEQISLLCNMEGARLLAEAAGEPHVQAVYRVHPVPQAGGLLALHQAIEAIVASHGLDPQRWRWRWRGALGESGESLAEYLERLPVDPAQGRVRLAIERLAMRASQAATFSIEQGPHWGVGAESYSRISSPMREIVGIFTHKELLERLGDPSEACEDADDEALRLLVVEAGNRARSIQRELAKRVDLLVIDQLLEDDLTRKKGSRPWRVGTLVSVRPTRMYLELDDPPLELKIYLRSLVSPRFDDLTLEPGGVAIRDGATGRRYVIGEELHLRVLSHDRQRRRWTFELRHRTS